MSNCPVCFQPAKTDSPNGFDGEEVQCPRCGNFRISGSAIATIQSKFILDDRRKANASGWIRQHQNEQITSDTVETLLNLISPRVQERSIYLLKLIEKKSKFLGNRLNILRESCADYLGITYSSNVEELLFLADYLDQLGQIDIISRSSSGITVFITPSGYAALEQLRYSNAESQIGFCAMWFDSSVKPIWTQVIHPAISDAGYEPKRIDEHHHNNRIDDEIIALIRRSKFVVADFTGQRGGVYFEAGFALGMNLPVIWTVKKSELSSVHFDNRQYNFVTWEEDNLSEFKLNLQYRIEATLGRGTWKPE